METPKEVSLDGPGAFAVKVAGASQHQRALEAAAEEGVLVDAVLVLEDDNVHDDHAVAVHIGGARAGYLSRADARLYRAHLTALGEPDLRVRCKARVTGGFETREGGRAHFGLRLDLPRFSTGGV